MVHDSIVFESIEPIEIPVTISGVDYVLKEANGKAACDYRNAMLAGAELDKNGNVAVIKGLANIEPLLVARCLYRIVKNPEGPDTFEPVLEEQVLKWPSRVLKVLFAKAKEISELGEATDEKGEEHPTQDAEPSN